MRKTFWAITVVASQICLSIAATANATDLISNGNFENNGGVGQINGTISYATDWARTVLSNQESEGFAFIMDGNADSTGAPSIYTPQSGRNVKIWGPANGSNNGFTVSPDGGDFMALSGSFGQSSISQTVTGLTVGQEYVLAFYWAQAQLTDVNGNYWAQLDVTFGADTVATSQVSVPNAGFGQWALVSNNFTATSSSQTLTFVPSGAIGLGPMVLLDGVSLTVVPEPSTLAMGGIGTLLVGWLSWRKQQRIAPGKSS